MNLLRSAVLTSILFIAVGPVAHAASYYVDDGSTSGNVFTTNPGNDSNNGLTPATPKKTLTNLLATVSLAPNDVVYIDTGLYSGYTTEITNSGTVGNPIIFRGSTNRPAGGTVIKRNSSSADVIGIRGNYIEFRDMKVCQGRYGFNGALQFPPPSGVVLDGVTVSDNNTALRRGNWTIRRSLFINNTYIRDPNSSSFDFAFCTFWGNGEDTTNAEAPITLNNSVYVGGTLAAGLIGDYNVFWDVLLLSESKAYLYEQSMPNSMFADPQFADPATSNFYPKSLFGRYNPTTGTIVTDTVRSVLIDFGNPASTAWTNEPPPTGDRVNAGAYGGTTFASKSCSNAWVRALTFSDGGAVTGTTQQLIWNYGEFTNAATVSIQFSTDDGASWSNITTGVSVSNRMATWNVTGLPSTAAVWRIISEANTNIQSRSRQPFSLGGARVPYYLNDASTSNSFYTSAPGSDLNDGLSPATPMRSLTNLLRQYTVGRHDIVYVDTGGYSNYTTVIRRYGIAGQPLIIQGAPQPGATVFSRNGSASVFEFLQDYHLLRNLTLRGSSANAAINGGVVTLEDSIVRDNTIAFRRVDLDAVRSVIWSNDTVIVSDTDSFDFDNCVFWRNGQIQSSTRPWSASNSVIAGGLVNALPSVSAADYNVFWNVTLDGYPNLSELQRVTGQWTNSTYLNPLFIAPDQGRFYPKSLTGRWEPNLSLFLQDSEHSPLIDLGNPSSSAYTNEPAPNGNRLNAGNHGGTSVASKSRTNAWLQVLSLNDGGQLNVLADSVNWTGGNLPTGATVRIEFSFNSGSSWSTFETNVPASLGTYAVNNTNFTSVLFARWRVVLESDPGVLSSNRNDFTYKSGPFVFYVNDSSTVGDVYCSAVGNDANLGTTPDFPKATLRSVLTNYALAFGDVVYVDTGVYQDSKTVPITLLASGTNGNPVVIQGSDNYAAGGSVIRGPNSAQNQPAFTFSPGVQDIKLRDFVIRRQTIGVKLTGNARIELERLRIESNLTAGVQVSGGTNIVIRNSVIRENYAEGLDAESGGSVAVLNSVIWNNRGPAISTENTLVQVTNSALSAGGAWNHIYVAPTFTNIVANYNLIRVDRDASVARISLLDRSMNTLSSWQRESGKDLMSLDAEPHFVDATNGNFRLRSQKIQGRFDPILGWVTDTVTSPLIDAGDPSFPFDEETSPDGGRVNIGLYGNHPQASRTDIPRLFAGSLNQGGHVQGTSTLHWVAGALSGGDLVSIEYSPDGGESWTVVSTGIAATAEAFAWDTTVLGASVASHWRVTALDDPGITSSTTNFFGIRNGALSYYVNDSSTLGSIFTTGAGSATNWVASPSRPLNSLVKIFDRYDLEPGDRVFVDRGTYFSSIPVTIGAGDSGSLTAGVISVIGSTTCSNGATPNAELSGYGSINQIGIFVDRGRHIAVSNIVLRNFGRSLSIDRGEDLQFSGVASRDTITNSVSVNLSTNVEFRRALVTGSGWYGMISQSNTNVRLVNSLFTSNDYGSIRLIGGSLGITNSAFVEDRAGMTVLTLAGGQIKSDYNNFRVDPLVNMARRDNLLYKNLTGWRTATSNDLHSLSHDPGFASESDFHLLSEAGRYDASSCGTVTDGVTSVMIDAGSPASGAGSEPAPNGSRRNIGLYGGSVEASRSSTNSYLLTLSLNSGGTIRGTNELFWYVSSGLTGELVYIDFSFDNGTTWTNIATNLTAGTGSFIWNSSELESTSLGRWRIALQANGSVFATNETAFTLKNGAIGYFVNDANPTGDVYCTSIGLSENDGLSPDTPVDNVGAIFSRYQPGQGDVIYVDTGNYGFSETISLDQNFSGVVTNPIVVQGSTNYLMGGSRFDMDRQGPLFEMTRVNAFSFNDLRLANTKYGFVAQVCSNILFERVIIAGATNINDSSQLAAIGIRLDSTDQTTIRNSAILAVTNSTDSAAIVIRKISGNDAILGPTYIQSSVLWSNLVAVKVLEDAPLYISNSVIHAVGERAFALQMKSSDSYGGDYNNFRIDGGAYLAELERNITDSPPNKQSMSFYFSTLQTWRDHTGDDQNTLSYEPLFADPYGLDFGLRSEGGRWTPSGVVTDEVTSALIDMGNPSWAVGDEPSPNGSRINIGINGGTERASYTPASKALMQLSLHDGGIASGTNVLLKWDYRGDFSTNTVSIRYKAEPALVWQFITSAVPATQKQLSWNSTAYTSELNRVWGIFLEGDITTMSGSDKGFAIRNTNFVFYINDASTTGDVYTTTFGSPTNSGFSASEPKGSLGDLFDIYNLVWGDTVYIDTGTYGLSENITITPRDERPYPGFIRFIGSTNEQAGGSVFSGGGLRIQNARDLLMRDVRIEDMGTDGVRVDSVTNVVLEGIRVTDAGNGMYLQNCVNLRIARSVVSGSSTNGIRLFGLHNQVSFDRGIILDNNGFAVTPVNLISVSNSVLGASGSGRFLYSGTSNTVYSLNHNLYFLVGGARIGQISFNQEPFPREYATMSSWRKQYLCDTKSQVASPDFYDIVNGDYHPLSTGGRWSGATTNFVNDAFISPLVDAGSPDAAYTNEVEPNGARVNIGIYGNTAFASKSPTNGDYLLLSLNDGGSVSGTNVVLSWVARGAATGHTATVEVSVDGGLNWSVLASNLPPSTTEASWNTTGLASTVVGLWRITSEVQPSVTTEAADFFAVRNGPVIFYINDASSVGDIYTVSNGLATAFGISPETPMDSLYRLVNQYDVEPGDVIYMDTGVYATNVTYAVDQLDTGFELIGSTNSAAGGTRLVFSGVAVGLDLNQAPNTTIRNLRFDPVSTAIDVDNAAGVTLSGIQIKGATTGILIGNSTGVVVRNSSIVNSGDGIYVRANSKAELNHLVLWSNQLSAVRMSGSDVELQNSVVGVYGDKTVFGFDLDSASAFTSDHNLFTVDAEAVVARRQVAGSTLDLRWQNVATWSLDTGNDVNSLAGDPGFVNASMQDFHPLSEAGRYDIATGAFTNDSVTSVLIDSGAPLSPFASETGANGLRANIGMHGNTYEASRSSTNSRIAVARLNDGGWARGDLVPLTWVAFGNATGHTLRLDASFDNGNSWSVIQTNVPANAEVLYWDSTTNATWFGRWRATSEIEPSVSDTSLVYFAVRNSGLSLYMNDTDPDGDIYTTSFGNDLNTGTAPSTPKLTLTALLDAYDLEPGDTIYVDTGSYIVGGAVEIDRYDAWNDIDDLGDLQAGGTSLRIVGNTNEVGDATRFIRFGAGNVFELDQALGVHLAHLTVSHNSAGSGISFELLDSPYALLEWCRTAKALDGFFVRRSDGTRLRHVVARQGSQRGVMVRDSVGVELTHSVLWSNAVGLRVDNEGSVSAYNNAVVALAPDSTCWQRNDGPDPVTIGTLIADYNLLYAGEDAYLAELVGLQYPAGRRRFQKMANWKADVELDLRSISDDPYFADPVNGDFHPASPYGRFDVLSGYVTNALDETSRLIDLGNPLSEFARETAPNGLRANIGLYGNTAQSSLSPTGGTLQAITFWDGGSDSGLITLRWAASGPVASHLLTLEYSSDGGATWTNVANNVSAGSQSYLWDSVPYGRAAAGLWRIYSQTDSNFISQTENFFALRQGGSIPYYINDASTTGDVYCTAIGNDANNGFLPASPKATLQELLDDIDLEPGDVIYMDTGLYSVNLDTLWEEFDSGIATNPVILIGSTNFTSGGSVMNRITGLGNALRLSSLQGTRIEHMTFAGGRNGLAIEFSPNTYLYNVTARDNGDIGVNIAGSDPVHIENSLFWNNISNGVAVGLASIQQQQDTVTQPGHVELRNNTFWGSLNGLKVNLGGTADVRNNLFRANGSASRIYYFGLNMTAEADYNAYYRENGALMAEREVTFGGNEFFGVLLDWQKDSGGDFHSLSHDPLTADSNIGDFHLLSAAGRFLPGGSVTNDPASVYSPLIDTGDPASVFTNETAPNGDRVNIGRYGNTEEASRSRTNGWLLALTLNDGGRIAGTNVIRWAAGNWPTSSMVRLEYANNGVDFSILASNVPVYLDGYEWDVSGEDITQLAKWKVISEGNPTIFSETLLPFVIKNEPLFVYVNDNNTSGDVYTTAPGNVTNSGRSADAPLNDPGVALDKFPLSEGDVVYIDTGSYNSTNSAGLRLGLVGDIVKSGLPGEPITVIGSTNVNDGGTRINYSGKVSYGLEITETKNIRIEHMRFNGFTNGVLVKNSSSIDLESVNAYNGDVGFLINNVISARMARCASYNNDQYGVSALGDFTSATWDHGVMWRNSDAALKITFGNFYVYNSILIPALSNSLIYEMNSQFSTIDGDFNMYWPELNEFMMKDVLNGVQFRNVRSWQAYAGMDTNSFINEPLFAEPAAGDFHVKSTAGRYLPLISGFFTDTSSSWAIDAGTIGEDFGQELEPNGDRVNIGIYGNTSEASLSPTNRGLLVVSMRDGGTAPIPAPLIWLTSGLTTSDTVRIEYTPNEGIDWYVLTNNFPALNRVYQWNNLEYDSTPLAQWRIILEADTNITDTSSIFTHRPNPIPYYVNDTSQVGDHYTGAPGSSTNNGITPMTPVHSVQAIVDRFDLEGGDYVYIDTGYYVVTNNIQIRTDDSGNQLERTVFIGSTNRAAGGSHFYRIMDAPWGGEAEDTNAVFELIRLQYAEFANMILENANIGIFMNNAQPQASYNYIHDIEVRDGGYFGMRILGSQENTLERVLIHRMAWKGIVAINSSATLLSSVIWSNLNGAIRLNSSIMRATNSFLHASGSVTNSAVDVFASTMISDYNNYLIEDDASYFIVDDEPITGLPQWTQLTTQDLHSISIDPLFNSPTNSDFHPLSPAGRYDPDSFSFVSNDVEFSWLIDTGDPDFTYTNETAPDGSRINIGLHGNTVEASRGRTEPWLLAVTAMAGGRIGGIFPLHWFYGNLDSTNLVHLDFSVDGGTNWHSVVSNLAINTDGYLWNSDEAVPFNQSPTTKWRVRLAGNTNIMDETERTFGLNGPFRFYVNNGDTTNDVFTTAIGNDANLGISSNAPKATLRALLDSWDIDPLDYVYVDTGHYLFQSNDLATVRLNNRGAEGQPVAIVGSTNGAVFDGSAVLVGESITELLTIEAPYIEVENLIFVKSAIDAVGTNIVLRNLNLQRGRITLRGAFSVLDTFILTNGFVEAIGTDMEVRSGYVSDGSLELAGVGASLYNTIIVGNRSPLVKISSTNVTVVNNTLVADRTAILQEGGDSLSSIRNNIIIADGLLGTAYAIQRGGGVIHSDYNLFQMRNGAWFGNAQDGLWERLIYWQERSGGDLNSIADVPLFVNEAQGDYRLKSVVGHWATNTWVADAVHSPAIDAGDPTVDFSGETSPNGARLNIGAYGGTEQASLSRTNPWLYAITMNDGGVIRGTNSLRWIAGAMDPTNRVTLQYSADGGTNWITIVSDVAANAGSYTWDTTTAPSTLSALWRVVQEADPSVLDESDSIFNIRNDVRSFYVNNVQTNGDIYTTAPGSSANDGLSPATPKAALDELLAVYDTEAFDTIYVDTGVYTSPVIQVIWSRGGNSNGNMRIQGSTNFAYGGSVIKRPSKAGSALVLDASYVNLRHITFENSGIGLLIETSKNALIQGVVARSNRTGIAVRGGNNHTINSSVVAQNSEGGVSVGGTGQIALENLTLVNNTPNSIVISNVVVASVQNNIFYHDIAFSNTQAAIAGDTGTVGSAFIDYNIYYFGSAAPNTRIYGNYTDLIKWQRERAKDFRSAITNPLFVGFSAGDYHVVSENGHYDTATDSFITDPSTSWAVDKGNPLSDFSVEPSENGGRVNVGAFGNTSYASKGSTNAIVFVRTGNGLLEIDENDNPYPLVWYVLNVPNDLTFSVQYSGDGGVEWTTIESGVDAYQEYIIWTNSPAFNSFGARWRVVGEGAGSTNYWDVNDGEIETFFGVHRISTIALEADQSTRFVWRGAWEEDYQPQYSTNFIETENRYEWIDLGPVTNLTIGGDTPYFDLESTNHPYRVYRVIWLGTNGIPYGY